MISKQKKSVEKTKKPVEKPKKLVEKTKKPFEKTKKPVEKSKKPVEKTKKPVEKPKKPVEKPKKPVPKKRVKNVNVDKIINIIKKYIIKCGIKNPKLKRRGGGKISDFLARGVKSIASTAQSLTTKKFGNKNECFENLKAIDVVFASIKDDVISARKELLKSLESQKINDVSDIFNKLINKYKFIKTGNDANKIYNYKYNTEIKNEFSLDDIENIEINNYLILYTIDIVAQLELYREGMLLCANYTALVDNADATQKIKDYNNTKLDLFESDKESILNSVDSDTSDEPVQTTPLSNFASTVSLQREQQLPTQEADNLILTTMNRMQRTRQNTQADAHPTSVSSILNQQSRMNSPFSLNTSTLANSASTTNSSDEIMLSESSGQVQAPINRTTHRALGTSPPVETRRHTSTLI
jgi:hypothetical protein